MNQPSFSLFGSEALRAWHLWAGATPLEAAQAARGEGGPAAWMPIDPETGLHATPARFMAHLEGFAQAYGLGPEWQAPEIAPRDLPAIPRDALAVDTDTGGGALVLGLTGEREAGKSIIGRHLMETHGFVRSHPFNPGKALLRGYYCARGADEGTALAMTDGDLKNAPSPVLPRDPDTGAHYSSRWLMERMGNYMATRMGVDWTIGVEMRRTTRVAAAEGAPLPRMLIESVVYEEPVVRSFPHGRIARLEIAPEARGDAPPPGEISDGFVDRVRPDFTLVNRKDGIAGFIAEFDALALASGLDYGQDVPADLPEP